MVAVGREAGTPTARSAPPPSAPPLADLVVAAARDDDLPSLSAAWPDVPVEVHRRRLEDQGSGASTYLAATSQGLAAGTAVVRWSGCHGEAARRARQRAVEVTDLQVVSALRGRRVGSALLRAAENHALQRGIDQVAVSVDVGVDGERARRLYRRLGYEPTGVVDTCTYCGIGDDGVERAYTEASELLMARLVLARPG